MRVPDQAWGGSKIPAASTVGAAKVRFSTLSSLAFSLNRCVDRRRYDDISVPEVKQHVEDGTIFNFLVGRLGRDLDLSLFDEAKMGKVADAWLTMDDILDERRKFGIENKGLCLLVAYLVEMMQHPSTYGFELPAL